MHRYYVYVDKDGMVTWGPEHLDELFRDPQDAGRIMNSPRTDLRNQVTVGDYGTWELVGPERDVPGTVVLTAGDGEIIDTAPLDPNTLHEVNPDGISTRTGITRGEHGFEPIDPSADPVHVGRPAAIT